MLDEDDDPHFTDDIMEKIAAGVIDMETFLENSNLTEAEKEHLPSVQLNLRNSTIVNLDKAIKRKKMKLYKQYKEMAEAMGDGTTVEDIRRNMKKMMEKVKTKNIVLDENGNVQFMDARDLIDDAARSVMSRMKTGKNLKDDLKKAAEFFDEKNIKVLLNTIIVLSVLFIFKKKQKKIEKEIRRAEKAAKKAKKEEKRARRKEKDARRRRGEIVSSETGFIAL